jgi:hypothetical protein
MNTYILITKPPHGAKAYIVIGAQSAHSIATVLEMGKMAMPYEIYRGEATALINGMGDNGREDMSKPLVHSVRGAQLTQITFMDLVTDMRVETSPQYDAEAERYMENSQKETNG